MGANSPWAKPAATLSWLYHRKHTFLLKRKRVNKGMKEMNSLP